MDVIHCCHPLAIIVSQFTVFPRNDRLCYTVKSISRIKVCLRTVPVRQKLPHVVKTTNLKVICQKFLERGHVYMEVDSMHAATEFAKKSVPVFPTHEWQYIFRAAWKQKPYDVVPLAHMDCWIWSTCMSSAITRLSTATKINWLKVKCLTFEKSHLVSSSSEQYQSVSVRGCCQPVN